MEFAETDTPSGARDVSPRNRLRVRVLVAAVVSAAALLSACGSDEGGADGSGQAEQDASAQARTVEGAEIPIAAPADGSLDYDVDRIEATPGQREIVFENPSDVVHDVTIERDGSDVAATDRVTDGTITESVQLEPGTYAFYCSITGHRAAGMEGTLVIE